MFGTAQISPFIHGKEKLIVLSFTRIFARRCVVKMEILITDDNPKVRSALRFLLEQNPLPVKVIEITEIQELFGYLKETSSSVILLDWEMPGFQARDDLQSLRSFCPGIRVIAMSSRFEACHEALAAGADAFISRSDPPEKILETIYGQFFQSSRCSSSSQRL